MPSEVIDLGDAADQPVAEVGGKARALGHLLRSGLDVPPGFCITVSAFTPSGPGEPADNVPALDPAGVEAVRAHWESLSAPHGAAVRSSATTEDAAAGSAAGQYLTVLEVRSFGEMLTAVGQCWRSQQSATARAYHARTGIDPHDVAMAVIVQAMVRPTWAGVAFSAEGPVADDAQSVIIEAVRGLGEGLVDGRMEPERAVLSRRDPYPVEFRESADETTAGSPLEDAHLQELTRTALAVEALMGGPQDIEWALDDDGIHLLQARPITAVVPRPEPPVKWVGDLPGARWARMSICDSWLSEPLSPLFATTMFPHLIDNWATNWGGPQASRAHNPLIPDPMHGTVNGFAYLRFDYPLSRYPLRTLLLIGRWLRFHLSPVERQWRQQVLPTLETGLAEVAEADLATLEHTEVLRLVETIAELSSRYWAVIGGLAWHWNASEWLLTAMITRAGGMQGQSLSAGSLLIGEDRYARRAESTLDRIAAAPPEAESALVQDYLRRYGHLVYNLDFVEPTPVDDPSLLRSVIADRRADAGTAAGIRPAIDDHERQLAELRRAARRQPLGQLLYRVYRWADHWSEVRDAALHSFTRGWPFMRAGYRELGRRLVADGILGVPDDVFYLTGDELRTWATGQTTDDMPHTDTSQWRQLVGERRQRRQRQRRLSPPDVVPSDARISLFGMDITSLALFGVSADGDEDEGLAGSAVSPGKYTGRARVLHEVEQADLLEQGEVLVVRHLTPAWAPLLARASAVIADVGGALSHGSVVAREYGVPAVMGVKNATARINSGDLVTVDGDAGAVRVHPPP